MNKQGLILRKLLLLLRGIFITARQRTTRFLFMLLKMGRYISDFIKRNRIGTRHKTTLQCAVHTVRYKVHQK